jgi:hypothetical protein
MVHVSPPFRRRLAGGEAPRRSPTAPLTVAGLDKTKMSDFWNWRVQFLRFWTGAFGSCSFHVATMVRWKTNGGVVGEEGQGCSTWRRVAGEVKRGGARLKTTGDVWHRAASWRITQGSVGKTFLNKQNLKKIVKMMLRYNCEIFCSNEWWNREIMELLYCFGTMVSKIDESRIIFVKIEETRNRRNQSGHIFRFTENQTVAIQKIWKQHNWKTEWKQENRSVYDFSFNIWILNRKATKHRSANESNWFSSIKFWFWSLN